MSMNLKIRHVSGVTVLDLSGKITLGEGSIGLRDAIRDAARSKAQGCRTRPGPGKRGLGRLRQSVAYRSYRLVGLGFLASRRRLRMTGPRRAYRAHSGDDVGRELVLDESDAVAQLQFDLFQALQLDEVGARRILQRDNRG